MKRIYRVETIVRERRSRLIEADSLSEAEDEAVELDENGATDNESCRITVEDVRLHDSKDVTEDYRDSDRDWDLLLDIVRESEQ